jgi:hypothetical protein
MWGRFFVGATAVGCLGLSGCVIESSEEGSDLLRECRGSADAEQHVEIVVDYDQSIHEMVACGGLNVTLIVSVTSGIIDAIIDNNPDATPAEWEFQGDGTYYTNSADAEMTTRFYANQDYSFAAQGEVLTENLFRVDTYLVGARVEADIDISDPFSSSVSLTFDDVGPYVELLGYGEAPESPIMLDTSAWDRVQTALGGLVFDSQVSVFDEQSVSTVRYDVHTTQMPASALISGAGMGFELDMADANRTDIGQSLVVENWGIEFVDANPGALTGAIDFRVEGGEFTYYGSLTYDNDTFGTPAYRCDP